MLVAGQCQGHVLAGPAGGELVVGIATVCGPKIEHLISFPEDPISSGWRCGRFRSA
jgi:hypothetical protein